MTPSIMLKDLNPVTIAALAAAGAVLISAFFAGIVSMITAWRTVAGSVKAIEVSVNGAKAAAESREALLRRENELLRNALAEHKTTAALLAQAAATRMRPPAPTIAIPEGATIIPTATPATGSSPIPTEVP